MRFTKPWTLVLNSSRRWPRDSGRHGPGTNGSVVKVLEEAAVAEFVRRGKTEIRPNVDFYSAPVYHLMGIPRDLFTPIFAISRIAGWCSHIIEEKFAEAQEKPALYRPQAEYVGNYCGLVGCVYDPVEARPTVVL
jgi:citrate synthase